MTDGPRYVPLDGGKTQKKEAAPTVPRTVERSRNKSPKGAAPSLSSLGLGHIDDAIKDVMTEQNAPSAPSAPTTSPREAKDISYLVSVVETLSAEIEQMKEMLVALVGISKHSKENDNV